MKLSRGLAATLALLLAGLGPALAFDPLGTAGRFRFFPAKNCGAPVMEQMRGACDPPQVSEQLAPAERVRAHMKRAIELISFMRLDAAYEEVGKAVATDPKDVEALVFRVRLARTKMAGDAVERDMNAAFLVAPDNPFLLATRAEWQLEKGNAWAALRDVSAALQQQPDDEDMLFISARTWMQLDRYDAAKKDLDRALELEPDDSRAWLFRAQLHLRRGEFEQAVSDASALLARRASDVAGRETRALAYTALGRNDDAIDDLSFVLGPPGDPGAASPVSPRFSQLFMQRAILLTKAGRTADANLDVDTIFRAGGKRALLRMQLFLRKNGFSKVAIDGTRSASFDSALEACFINQTCGGDLVRF